MPTKKTNSKTPLSTWLFKIPAVFTGMYSVFAVLLVALFAGLQTVLGFHDVRILLCTLFIAFIFSAYYYIIKKLPHDDMNRNDLIAIVNGSSIIAIIVPFVLLLFMGTNPASFQHKMMWMYVLHPSMFMITACSLLVVVLFLLGIAISTMYAKYKRAVSMGISKWKVICSMPFAFLLMWTPGYLIEDKNNKSNLEIKSKWYNKFNNLVISDIGNTLLVFLTFLLLRNVFAGIPVLLLTVFLLALYGIWNLKYKKNFTKNLDKGYALSAVFINITIIIAMLIF